MNILGIDYGQKKVGLAKATDDMALPFKIIANAGDDTLVGEIKALCETERIGKVVVGLPLSMKEADKKSIHVSYQSFIQALGQALAIPVETIDERLTSKAAQRLMQETGEKSKGQDDAVAAMTLLQNYIDSKRFPS